MVNVNTLLGERAGEMFLTICQDVEMSVGVVLPL